MHLTERSQTLTSRRNKRPEMSLLVVTQDSAGGPSPKAAGLFARGMVVRLQRRQWQSKTLGKDHWCLQ